MIFSILRYGDPILNTECAPVEEFGDRLKELAAHMHETMDAAYGVGLAAPQVGIPIRFFVIRFKDQKENETKVEMANPTIVASSGDMENTEGCLSLPVFRAITHRPEKVTVWGQDMDGQKFQLEAEGMLALALQHECDHLENKTFLERTGRMSREIIRKRIDNAVKRGEW